MLLSAFLPITAFLAISVEAIAHKRAYDGALQVDFNVLRGSSRAGLAPNRQGGLVRRADSQDTGSGLLVLTSQLMLYTSDLYFGSNGQKITVQVDTGSSDLWVMENDVVCNASPDTSGTESLALDQAAICTSLGTFQTGESDTFKSNDTEAFFSYGDSTTAEGIWGTDQIGFDGFNISDFNFAVVSESNSTMGILGIGPPGGETTNTTYENFPMRLKSDGLIHKNVFSLYLNQVDSLNGSVLFGAVDHAKYSGTLQTVPIIYNDVASEFFVVLDKITLEGDGSNETVTNVAVPALLDCGTVLSYFPQNVLDRFIKIFDAAYSESEGLYRVSCKHNKSEVNAIFDFSGVTIKVPMSDLILTDKDICYLGLLSSPSLQGNTGAVLGDNFLRSAYVVYDSDDLEILLAQAKYSDDQDIEVVTLTIPLAVRAQGYSSTSINSNASDTGSALELKVTETESSSSSSSALGSSSPKNSAAHKESVALIIPIFLLGCITAFVWM
ncbi:CIC11C00000003523 [Sungouiella intermedia]|uniref:candidapepsin n=1 Tax=Sungouiella intermedia TaxID=45354 RepID=A0A1L0BLF7_9ASCO|nr:CIC11C00000003523 [[Candida] intermedia]